MSLRDAAAAAAAAATNGTAAVADATAEALPIEGSQPAPAVPQPAPVPPEVIAYEEATPAGDPEKTTVFVAWNRVMRDVKFVGKNDQVTAGPTRFNYRGVDRALQAFGPACRRHGVTVVPEHIDVHYAPTTTAAGKAARECTVVVTYRIYGPTGDSFTAMSAGESIDTSDKAVPKALAVALRTLLYHMGLVPTGDPDPDAVTIERGEAQIRSAASYRDEALDPNTSKTRLRQIYNELRAQNRLSEVVINEVGDEETIGNLVARIGKERQ